MCVRHSPLQHKTLKQQRAKHTQQHLKTVLLSAASAMPVMGYRQVSGSRENLDAGISTSTVAAHSCGKESIAREGGHVCVCCSSSMQTARYVSPTRGRTIVVSRIALACACVCEYVCVCSVL